MNRACCSRESAVQLLAVPIKAEILTMVTAGLQLHGRVGRQLLCGTRWGPGREKASEGQSPAEPLKAASTAVGTDGLWSEQACCEGPGLAFQRTCWSPGERTQWRGNVCLQGAE